MSPFRGYKFQISETQKGEWDLASTEVLGLANIILATENLPNIQNHSGLSIYSSNFNYPSGSAAKSIFRAMVAQVIVKLAKRFGLVISIDRQSEEKIDDFCQKTYDYVKNLM
jgi:hypothetical protein